MNKKRLVAALLAFFFGPLGLHKFYLRDFGAGIFYIFLTFMLMGWFRLPITFFLGIIDGLKLLGMSDEMFDDKYNRRKLSRRKRRRYESKHAPPKKETVRKERYRYNRNKRQRQNPFKTSALKKYKDFDLEEAVSDFHKALEISPDDAEIHFTLAAIHSLLEQKEKSYFHLQRARESGYDKMEQVQEMDDFAYLRIQQDFQAFVDNGFSLESRKAIKAPEADLLQDDLLLSRLNKLKKLRDKGLLSEKEFLYEKEKLLKG